MCCTTLQKDVPMSTAEGTSLEYACVCVCVCTVTEPSYYIHLLDALFVLQKVAATFEVQIVHLASAANSITVVDNLASQPGSRVSGEMLIVRHIARTVHLVVYTHCIHK